ncbi:hypothetical protein V6N13_099682 [Hibiscus sabdariffa]
MRQSIQSLVSADGIGFETQAEISNEIVSFFCGLLGSKDLGVNGAYVQLLQELLPSSLYEDEANHLSRRNVLKQIALRMTSHYNLRKPLFPVRIQLHNFNSSTAEEIWN